MTFAPLVHEDRLRRAAFTRVVANATDMGGNEPGDTLQRAHASRADVRRRLGRGIRAWLTTLLRRQSRAGGRS